MQTSTRPPDGPVDAMAALRGYGVDEDLIAEIQARWEADCADTRARESALLANQNQRWVTCRSMRGAADTAALLKLQDQMPTIVNLAALSDGDYCDLGEAVYNLINRSFREAAKMTIGGNHE